MDRAIQHCWPAKEHAVQHPASRALLFYGTNGSASVPLGGGTRCVESPIARLGLRSTGGSAASCSGQLAVDVNARVGLDPALASPGTVVWAQAWARDPAAANGGTVLSNALRFTMQP